MTSSVPKVDYLTYIYINLVCWFVGLFKLKKALQDYSLPTQNRHKNITALHIMLY